MVERLGLGLRVLASLSAGKDHGIIDELGLEEGETKRQEIDKRLLFKMGLSYDVHRLLVEVRPRA